MPDTYSREELLKIANQRLYPSLTNPSYLVQRARRRILGQWIERIPGNRLTVLDIGGRYQPYRPMLADRIERYIALDVLRTALVDVLGKGQQLPFKSDTFDLVIATGVFEYFPDPRAAAVEVHRVLKPGGHLMMSVASVYPRVVDEEHWRYLPAGLRYVLAPFSAIEIVPEVASIGGFLRVTASSLSILARYRPARQILHHTVVPFLNIVGVALDRPSISRNDQIAGNYCALARK
ncbi:MAG TPA: class I SAM-dependent methyltransferase [Terriglobales bacterium]|nr:class I SAM-dependent methyltransferase [Terriglobales bacterium]